MKGRCTLAAVMVLLALCACRNSAPATRSPSTMEYTVTVLAPDRQPADGVVVRFIKDGRQVGMQSVDKDGRAASVMVTGDYAVELDFAGGKYYYRKADAVLSPEKTSVTISLAYDGRSGGVALNVPTGQKDALGFSRYQVKTVRNLRLGDNFVTLTANGMSYFLFEPLDAGVYRVSSANDSYYVGYYGTRHYVHDYDHADQRESNSILLNIQKSMIGSGDAGTNILVLGVANPYHETVDTLLTVTRVGDAREELPWTKYRTTHVLTPFVTPDGSLRSFDLTAPADAYHLVLDEETGYYHLGTVDGPLVMVCLGKASDNTGDYAHVWDSFETVLRYQGVRIFIHDQKGEIMEKLDFGDCLLEYIGQMDSTGKYSGGYVDRQTGLYPLTQELKYIIQSYGDYQRMWDADSPFYLFVNQDGVPDFGINPELAWLFCCVYAAN